MPAGGRRPDSTEGDTFYIHLDLPGIRADSITFTVEQNVLTVRAERTGSKQRQRSREVTSLDQSLAILDCQRNGVSTRPRACHVIKRNLHLQPARCRVRPIRRKPKSPIRQNGRERDANKFRTALMSAGAVTPAFAKVGADFSGPRAAQAGHAFRLTVSVGDDAGAQPAWARLQVLGAHGRYQWVGTWHRLRVQDQTTNRTRSSPPRNTAAPSRSARCLRARTTSPPTR